MGVEDTNMIFVFIFADLSLQLDDLIACRKKSEGETTLLRFDVDAGDFRILRLFQCLAKKLDRSPANPG